METLFISIWQVLEPVVNWNEVLASFINVVLVMIVVQFLKNKGLAMIKEKFPWLVPILPTAVGFLLSYVTTYLTDKLGFPIDLSPIIGVFNGLLAVTAYEVGDRIGVIRPKRKRAA